MQKEGFCQKVLSSTSARRAETTLIRQFDAVSPVCRRRELIICVKNIIFAPNNEQKFYIFGVQSAVLGVLTVQRSASSINHPLIAGSLFLAVNFVKIEVSKIYLILLGLLRICYQRFCFT